MARDGEVLNCAQAFASENDAITGEVRMYSGGYILQLGKALSVYLRAAAGGLARRIRAAGCKGVGRDGAPRVPAGDRHAAGGRRAAKNNGAAGGEGEHR